MTVTPFQVDRIRPTDPLHSFFSGPGATLSRGIVRLGASPVACQPLPVFWANRLSWRMAKRLRPLSSSCRDRSRRRHRPHERLIL